MFRRNQSHGQRGLFDGENLLPDSLRERLEGSWAGTFYHEVFARIDETLFAELYSEQASRPNAPVNVLVCLEILKSGFGWSDAVLYDRFCFDLQVRHAVGLADLKASLFDVRTLYNFRRRVREYAQETGTNLMERVFEQVTDAQLEALEIETAWQRMDSTQVLSNVAEQSRLELIVSVLQQVWRRGRELLTGQQQAAWQERLADYLERRPHEICFTIAASERPGHLERLGRALSALAEELSTAGPESEAALLAQRVLAEQYRHAADGQLELRAPGQVSAESLQSPHDQQATYRKKGGESYRGGYVVGVSETCDPEGEVQLVTDVEVAPNHTDDGELLERALAGQAGREIAPEKMTTDGGFTGPRAEAACREHEVELRPTRLRGGRSAPETLGWEDYDWEVGETGEPEAIACPQGQRARVEPGQAEGRFIVRFSSEDCAGCPLLGGPCRVVERRAGPTLYVERRAIEVALLRRRICAEDRSVRAPVEATMRSIKRGLAGSTLPVRGLVRASMMLQAAALMVNLRRIHRYVAEQRAKRCLLWIMYLYARLVARPPRIGLAQRVC